MQYINWDKVQQKYKEYWARENHDRPLIVTYAPKEGYTPNYPKAPDTIAERWLNFDYVLKQNREYLNSIYYGGEAFPLYNPNLGPDILGAILGCDLEFGEHTSWATHIVHDWEKVGKFVFDRENIWWKRIKELTQLAVEDAKGDYFVGITDLHAGLDAVVSLRGPENLCYDVIDYPDIIQRVNFEIFEVLKQVFDELYNITSKNLSGTSNWMGIWHPEKWYVTSCDFICMISKEMFSEFVLDELKAELNWLDASVFHLDGPGAVKHLDALLELPNLNGIQWVPGAGQPPVSEWIPLLKKIQNAGKLIHATVAPNEMDILLKELKPEGVMYLSYCGSEQEAKDLIKKADASYQRKIY